MSCIQEEEEEGRKANWIGHSWHRKFLLKHVLEGKREERLDVNRRQGRKRKQLLNDLGEKRGNWNWREEIQITLAGELELEGAVKLSVGRQCYILQAVHCYSDCTVLATLYCLLLLKGRSC
jgi:hypothetical protein